MKAFVTVTQQQFDISAEQGVPEYSAFVTVSQEQFIIVVQDPTGDVLTQSVEFGNFIKGKDGSVIYNGSGVPTNTLGVNGDFYIDNVAPNNYYKKISGVWVLQGHLQGEQGTNGTNGNDGSDGVGIQSVLLVSTVGKEKTYRITFTDTTTFDYVVTDGNDGINGTDGTNGTNGIDGTNGVDGITPHIGLNFNWYIGATDTGVKAAGTDGTNGLDGTDGVGISNIEKTGTVLNVDEYTITFSDTTTFVFYVTNGLNGADGIDGQNGTNGTDGRGIVSIIKTSTVGLVDTYTITYTDETTSTFDVTNGSGGGEANIIEVVQVNSVPLEVTNKTVNVPVPTQPSDIGAEPEITYPTESPETKFYRGDKIFSTIAVGGGGWRANVYMQTSDSNVSGYKELLYTLEETETEIATTLTNTTVITQTYLYSSGVEVDMLPAGQWGFSETNKLNDTAGGGQVTVLYEVFAYRIVDEVPTIIELFSIESNPITWTAYTEMRTTKSIMGYAVLTTDRIGFRRSVISTFTNSKTLTYIVGDGRGGYMNTTVATRHKELRALNEDKAFQHIDSAVEFSGTIDEANDKLTIWDESQNKWIEFSFTEFKTFLASYHLKLDQSTPQTITGRQLQQDGFKLGLTPTVGVHETGKIFWDVDFKTPACELEDAVTLQIGQETLVYVYNGTGSTINQGDVVYSATTFNGVPSVALAKGDMDETSQVLGLITSTSILTGAYGYATIRGHVNQLDTSLFAVNDNLYLSAETAGKLTNVKPNTGDYDTRVGRVMIQNATTGRVYVNILREYKVGSISAGSGVDMYLDDTTITPSGTLSTYPIKTLSKTPIATAEDVDSIVLNNNTVMYGVYLNTAPIGKTVISGGTWTFDIWAGVSSATNATSLSQLVQRVRPEAGTITTTNLTATSKTVTASTGTPFATTKIDVGGTLLTDSFLQTPSGLYRILTRVSDTVITIEVPTTYVNQTNVSFSVYKTLFSVNTGEINNVATSPLFAGLQAYYVTTVQGAFTVETTDTLATTMVGTSTGSRTVYFSHNGNNRYTHFHTPLSTSHNDLSGLNDGDYKHLTATQLSATTTHLGDDTKHIDNVTAEFSEAIDETNDKLTIWDNSLLKWIRFSFTNLKSYLKTYFDTVYQAALGYTPENVSNKENTTIDTSTTKYPTVNLLKTGLDAKQSINLKFTDQSANSWVADTLYSGYGYRCELTLSGVAATDIAEVTFGHTEAISGNYSPACLTATDKVTIYSKVNTTITIPTILINKQY